MRRAVCLVPVLALLCVAAPASAAVRASVITAPGDPTYRVYNADLPPDSAANALTVTGQVSSTAPNSDTVDVRCFWTDSGGTLRANALATSVPLTGGTFSVTADPATLSLNTFGAGARDDAPGVQTCRLRATPHVDAISQLDTVALPDYAGPRIDVARFGSTTLGVRGGGNPVTVDYGVGVGGLRGQAEWSSRCGAFSFRPYVNAAAFSPALYPNWDCVQALLPPDPTDAASQVRVDGIPAYTGSSAPAFDFDANGTAERPTGAAGLAVDVRRGTTTGTLTSTETAPLQRCTTPTFPPTAASCPTLVGVGVSLQRSTVLDDDGLQATLVDVLRSTDGAAHAVDVDAEQYVVFDNDPVFRFPGEDAFAPHGAGDQPALGAAGIPASVYTRDAVTPDTPRQGTGVETWSPRPADVRFFATDFQYVERRTQLVPAGGGAISVRIFRVARSLAEAQAGAQAAEARLTPPPPPAPPPPPPAAPARVVRYCTVPKLARSSAYNTARTKIRRTGCFAGKVRRVRSFRKRGSLVRTRPAGGAKLPLGSKIAIDLSDGKGKRPAPKKKSKSSKRSSSSKKKKSSLPAAGIRATAPARPARPAHNARSWAPRG